MVGFFGLRYTPPYEPKRHTNSRPFIYFGKVLLIILLLYPIESNIRAIYWPRESIPSGIQRKLCTSKYEIASISVSLKNFRYIPINETRYQYYFVGANASHLLSIFATHLIRFFPPTE